MRNSLLLSILLMFICSGAVAHEEDDARMDNDETSMYEDDDYMTGDAAAIAEDERDSSLEDREKYEEDMDDLNPAGRTAASAQCREIYGSIDTVDADGDSQVTEDEFSGFYQECGIYADWDANDDELIDEEEFSAGLFDLYDVDNDGYIDDMEWERGLVVDDAGDEGFWDV